MSVSRLFLFSRWLVFAIIFCSVPGPSLGGRGEGAEQRAVLPIMEESHRHEVINTGIPAPGRHICWYDDTRLVFLKVRYSPGMSNKRVEGLYYLDMGHPHDIKQVNLAPLDPAIHREIAGIYCQEDAIWFYTPSTQPGITRLHVVKLGGPAELVSEMRGASGSLKGRYVIGSSRRTVTESGPMQGAFDGHDDCAVSYIKPGFRVLCWDLWHAKRWAFSTFVLAEYKWQDSINVLGQDGKPKIIHNPELRLLGTDGKPLQYALFARNLANERLFRVDEDENFFPLVSHGLVVNHDETYAYAPCSGADGPRGMADSVCRYKTDGKRHDWEMVFRFELAREIKASLRNLSVSSKGNIVFRLAGARSPHLGVWSYSGIRRAFIHMSQPNEFLDDAPITSPRGSWIVFYRSDKKTIEMCLIRGERQ